MLRGYGEVMSVVQLWEQALEILWWRTSRKHPNRPTTDYNTDRSQREIRRLETALQSMTVKRLAAAVTPHLEADTAADLEALTDARNRLAHRFLMERAVLSTDGGFQTGTHRELLQLEERFMASAASVRRTIAGLPTYRAGASPLACHRRSARGASVLRPAHPA